MPRPTSLACGLALALVAMPLAAEETAVLPIQGGHLALEYEAYKGGFRVMEIGIDLDLSEPGAYHMKLDGELVGAPALLFTYEIAMAVEGSLGEAGPQPERFRIDSINGKKRKPEWLQLDFDARKVPQVTGDPLPKDEARPPVTEPRRKGASDLLSSLLKVVQDVALTGGCELKAAVFDGRRRFDVVSTDAGLRTLPKSSINAFSGEARLCELTIKPIAGYRFDGRDKKNLPQVIEAYMAAPTPDLPAIPVRMIVRTGWGPVLVHIVGFQEGKSG